VRQRGGAAPGKLGAHQRDLPGPAAGRLAAQARCHGRPCTGRRGRPVWKLGGAASATGQGRVWVLLSGAQGELAAPPEGAPDRPEQPPLHQCTSTGTQGAALLASASSGQPNPDLKLSGFSKQWLGSHHVFLECARLLGPWKAGVPEAVAGLQGTSSSSAHAFWAPGKQGFQRGSGWAPNTPSSSAHAFRIPEKQGCQRGSGWAPSTSSSSAHAFRLPGKQGCQRGSGWAPNAPSSSAHAVRLPGSRDA